MVIFDLAFFVNRLFVRVLGPCAPKWAISFFDSGLTWLRGPYDTRGLLQIQPKRVFSNHVIGQDGLERSQSRPLVSSGGHISQDAAQFYSVNPDGKPAGRWIGARHAHDQLHRTVGEGNTHFNRLGWHELGGIPVHF